MDAVILRLLRERPHRARIAAIPQRLDEARRNASTTAADTDYIAALAALAGSR